MASNTGNAAKGGTTLTFDMNHEQLAVMMHNMQAHFHNLGFERGDLTLNDGVPPLAANVDLISAVQTMVTNAVYQIAGKEHGDKLQKAVFGGRDTDEVSPQPGVKPHPRNPDLLDI